MRRKFLLASPPSLRNCDLNNSAFKMMDTASMGVDLNTRKDNNHDSRSVLLDRQTNHLRIGKSSDVRWRRTLAMALIALALLLSSPSAVGAFANEFDKTEQFLDKINLEQSIAAVLQKVAYGSTTKRSIPDTAYPVTTLATPLLTTYRYSDGNDEYFRVDVKGGNSGNQDSSPPRVNVDYGDENYDSGGGGNIYGSDLEKDHVLPTSAPAADILKNNNNQNYENPNRYKNDRSKPLVHTYSNGGSGLGLGGSGEFNEAIDTFRTTTHNPLLRNVRPTKSIYSKDVPSYVPPSRALFTPPLPPEFQNPFADKPTLRGTNSDSYVNRRPIPPPSLMPNKDRIPFRPDLPPSKVINMERVPDRNAMMPSMEQTVPNNSNNKNQEVVDKKKSLNTPSQNGNLDKVGEFYGFNRHNNHNDTNFEYEKGYIPSITRILSGSNGRHDDIPDVLLRSVTATPSSNNNNGGGEQGIKNVARSSESTSVVDENKNGNSGSIQSGNKVKTRNPMVFDDGQGGDEDGQHKQTPAKKAKPEDEDNLKVVQQQHSHHHHRNHHRNKGLEKDLHDQQQQAPSFADDTDDNSSSERTESITDNKKSKVPKLESDLTTQSSELNLPKVVNNQANVSQASKDEIWFIAWNVHVYLVVLCYVSLACYSIFKLVRYEKDPHMFTKSYFLTIHLMLTVICVLRIFYLTYDPYNVDGRFKGFLYDFLHNFPLSLLATTFTVLIQFLLKHTLTHLKVKTRPVFLVMFSLLHIVFCLTSSLLETFNYFDKASLIFCKTIFVLLAWSLGISYLYLYRIIKNVLAKKKTCQQQQAQSGGEESTARTSYASHITIAVALLFILLGAVQLYALFFIKIDRFDGQIKHHWILWSFELSVRLIEISIISLLVIVVSLRLNQREKQIVGFPLFPCTGSETSSQNDHMYPNNCNTNPNALTYSRQELQQQQQQQFDPDVRLNATLNNLNNLNNDVLTNGHLQQPQLASNGDDTSKCATLERNDFKCFERPKWGSDRSNATATTHQPSSSSAAHFDRLSSNSSSVNSSARGGGIKNLNYDTAAKYYKTKYHPQHHQENPYSEPVDQHAYERTRHDFEFRRNSRNNSSNSSNSNTSGRRSTTTGRSSRNKGHQASHHHQHHQLQQQQLQQSGLQHPRQHILGTQTLPPNRADVTETMIVDENGFVRFRHMHHDPPECDNNGGGSKRLHHHKEVVDTVVNHYSDA